ncbi:MAG: hypothetical protein JTT11_07430 [Candidatus Brockarchaeota archaeon]|nr:hypothetical protein [Candidatus Brockarchaeota archaeon]
MDTMNLVCKEAQRLGCDTKVRCEHAAVHQRDYLCSHYCDVAKKIVSCVKVKAKEAGLL